MIAGCGGETAAPPQLPPAIAERLAESADAVAERSTAGDPCGAARVALGLQHDTIAAIGDVPPRYQEELQSAVNDLADRAQTDCDAARAQPAESPPPVPPPPAPHGVPAPLPPPPPPAPQGTVPPGFTPPGHAKAKGKGKDNGKGKGKGRGRGHDDDGQEAED